MTAPQILVVDDEEMLRSALHRVLSRSGFEVAVAEGPAEALAVLEALPAPVEMVISDLNMPGGNGLELLAEVKVRWPNTLRLVLTADLDPRLIDAIATCAVHRCVSKPWDNRSLQKLVTQLFAAFGKTAQVHAG